MNRPHDNEKTLGALRELPAEMSLEQVGQMVIAFPLAGATAAWLLWSKLHLKSIVMTSSASVILGGSLYIATAVDPAPLEAALPVAEPMRMETTVDIPLALESPAFVLTMPDAKPEPKTAPPTQPIAELAPPAQTPSASEALAPMPGQPSLQEEAEEPVLACMPLTAAQMMPAVVFRPHETTRNYDLKGFTGVQLASSIDVVVSEGEFFVKAVGDKESIDRLRITVENGLLRVDKEHSMTKKYGCEGSVSVMVKMPYAQRFELLGSGNLIVGRFRRADDFSLGLAGSGDLRVEALAEARSVTINLEGSGDVLLDEAAVSEAVKIRIAGSGNVRVAGRSASLDVGVAGSGNVVAKDLRTGTVKVRIAGSGDVYVNSDGAIDSRVDGSGQVVQAGSSGGQRPRGVGATSY